MSQVSEQVLSSLLAKQVLAASPGVAATDLYYSSTNSKKEIIPSTTYVGRYVQSLQSTRWGSSSQITVPSVDLMGQVYLRIRLDLPPGCQVSQGWGYNCIQSIAYIWGSSNTSQLTITRESILAWLMTTSEPLNDQGTEILYQGGGVDTVAEVLGATSKEIEATLLLPLPMSTLCPNKPPFDQTLLAGSSPMIIRVDLAQGAQNVMWVNTANANALINLNASTGIKAGDAIFTNTAVLDTSLSLSSQLRADPSLISAYPFIHLQSFQSPLLIASASVPAVANKYGGLGSNPQTVNLTSFLRSDLIGIAFTLIDQADVSGRLLNADPGGVGGGIGQIYDSGIAGGSYVPPTYNPVAMLDIEVSYNGQRLFFCPGYSGQLINMRGRRGAAYFTQQFQVQNAAIITTPHRYIYPSTMFTTHKGAMDVCDSFNQPNTSRFPNQVLQVTFRSEETFRSAVVGAPTYILHCTYMYSALAEVDSSGRCDIIFS